MEEQLLRIEIKVDGVIVEVREFSTARKNTVENFWNFLNDFKKDIDNWNFAKFFRIPKIK